MKAIFAGAVLVASATNPLASSGPSPLGPWARGDGDRLVLGMKPENATHWAGQAFDPPRNLTSRMSFDVDRSSMQSQGCVPGGLVCRSILWTRIAS